jgi:hypothetical protein
LPVCLSPSHCCLNKVTEGEPIRDWKGRYLFAILRYPSILGKRYPDIVLSTYSTSVRNLTDAGLCPPYRSLHANGVFRNDNSSLSPYLRAVLHAALPHSVWADSLSRGSSIVSCFNRLISFSIGSIFSVAGCCEPKNCSSTVTRQGYQGPTLFVFQSLQLAKTMRLEF